MHSESSEILAERLKISLRVRELLGTDILGFPISVDADRSCGTVRQRDMQVNALTFSGSLRILPILRASLALGITGLLFALYQTRPDPVPYAMHAAAPAVPVAAETGALASSASASGTLRIATETVSGSMLSASSSSESSAPASPDVGIRADNKTGIFLTAASIKNRDFLLKTLDDLHAASGTALVFDVKGSSVLFHSAAPMANDIGLVKSIYELKEILALLKARGIYSIGRFVAIKDAGLTGKLPALRIKDPKTGTVLSETWVDPSNETAIRYNTEVICELASAGIDEINLDYIRFSTAEFGALRVYSGTEKADRVEVFIRAVRETIDRCGPKTKLGLSTYAILGWNYPANVETLGQDVVRFAPLVDIISPMAYPATFSIHAYYNPRKDPRSRMYYLVYRTLTGYQELLGPEQSKKLRPWIQGYGVTTKNMTDQMDAVTDAGLCGYSVWNANNAYAPTYSAMKKQHRPERCL